MICKEINTMRGVHCFRVDKVYPVERFLRLSVFPWCKDRPLIVMLW